MADGDLPPRRDRAPWPLALALAFLALACGPKNPYRPGAEPGIDAAEPNPGPPPDAAAPVDARPAPDAVVLADARPPDEPPPDTAAPPDAAPPPTDAAPPADAPAKATVAATPTAVPVRGRVMAAWAGVAQPTEGDWVGMYVPGAPDTPSITWAYTSSCGITPGATPRPAGTCALTVPAGPGTFELRLFSTDGYILLAKSTAFTVTP